MTRHPLHPALHLLGLLLLTACGLTDDTPAITQQALIDTLNSEQRPLLLDVRSRREFQSGHIAGALNVDIRELPQRLRQLEPYRHNQVIIYCETGSRARHAVHSLKDAGFTNIALLDGDMTAWRHQRLPLKRGRGSPIIPEPAPAPAPALASTPAASDKLPGTAPPNTDRPSS